MKEQGFSVRRSGRTKAWALILVCLLLMSAAALAFGAESDAPLASSGALAYTPAAANQPEQPMLPRAHVIARLGWFQITNSMVMTWIVALGLILFSQLATRKMKLIPAGLQNFWEWLVETLYDFLESIIGGELVRKTFWLFATIFIFILFSSWMGVFPGVGTLGWNVHYANGQTRWVALFRAANADLNLPLAMALVFFACWIVWALQARGPMGFLLHLFAPKGEASGALKLLLIVVFIAVGFLEIVSILVRPISLSFRLFGNIYAGEEMLKTMTALTPGLSWILPVPFYLMELLMGVVQAFIFMLLTAVFTMPICHEEEHT